MVEYLTLLIRKDDAALRQKIETLAAQQCGKCGDALPVTECCFSGEAACWNTLGWHALKL
ncbi:hypothetical protein [Xenorhabdus ehlersii]|uniref:hypothetical protein n=2 Tax=Morganellaceae TaxID=1903414 RepID=UPI001ABFD1DD|nr:hypothetical protein [Xenorhabdus ehlersii]